MKHWKKITAFLLVMSVLLSLGLVGTLADGEAIVEDVAADTVDVSENAVNDAYENAPESVTDDVTQDVTGDEDPAAEPAGEAELIDAGTAARPWVEPGNTDAEILGGGRFLNADGALYFSEGGIWREDDVSGTVFITADEGANLNLAGGLLYYTLGGDVRRVPASGGAAETVFSFGTDIRQMYVMGAELRFVSDGGVYAYDMDTGELFRLPAPEGTVGLIPTAYGDLYLTGPVRDYTLWADGAALTGGVEQAWTDGGYLAFVVAGETMQAPLSSLCAGEYAPEAYTLHSGEAVGNGLTDAEQLANEAAFLTSDTYAAMQEDLTFTPDGAHYTAENSNVATTAYTDGTMTDDQKYIVMRARQMADVLWTPLMWRYSWGGDNSTYVYNNRGGTVISVSGTTTMGFFQGGETYKGIPYSQAVSTGYVGWSLTIDEFVEAVNDTSSKFYSGYSHYSRTAPYYGSDCSGFASWAWDLPVRCTCTSMLPYSTRVSNSLSNLRIGDSLNNPNSHVVVVTNIGYDANGNVVSVEITEQTPSRMRVTCYGELLPGREYEWTGSLSYLQSYYFNGGYSIYRRSYSGPVSFTEYDSVTLEESGYAAAPLISLSVNAEGTAKLVTLLHTNKDAKIYYTTDGTKPTTSSTRFKKAFAVTETTTVKAIADCGDDYTGSYVLTYEVVVNKAEAPTLSVVSGALSGSTVSSGSKILLSNENGDTVYYTTDGSTPTKNSTPMTEEGLSVTKPMTIKAIAASSNSLNSDVVTFELKIGTFYTISATKNLTGGSISPAGTRRVLAGSNNTFKITPLEYYKITDVLVDGKSVGAVTSYTFSNVSGDHTITATFEVDLPFEDVSTQWYADSVSFVYARGLFAGTSKTEFSPNDRMTRGMFITVMGRMIGEGAWTDLEGWSGFLGITNGSGIAIRSNTTTSDESVVYTLTGSVGQHVEVLSRVPEGVDGGVWYRVKLNGVEGYMRETMPSNGKTLIYVYTGAFTDLPNGAYYTGYAQWAYIYGLMNGVSSTSFSPNRYISRQDICVILYRYLSNYTTKELSTALSGGIFADDSSIAAYARDAVYAMKNIGVISGYTDGTFRPTGYATRAEVATMFQRLYEYLYA